MFTGIVEELGTIIGTETGPDGVRLAVSAPVVAADAAHGDSIAVSGVCLTVVEVGEAMFTVDVVAETMRRSSLRERGVGARVNLERAMALGDRLGGHLVQGHVDGTGELRGVDPDGVTRFGIPAELSRYLVSKGSITVDGVSLTVVEAGRDEFTVALIPTTREVTTLGLLSPGDEVNIEVDVLAKHVERLAQPHLSRHAGPPGPATGDNGGVGEEGQPR